MQVALRRLNLLFSPTFSFASTAPTNQIIKTTAQIIGKKAINEDSYIYKFKFIDRAIGLAIGQHLRVVETIKTYQRPEGEQVARKYIPISPCSQNDVFEILFKIYRPNTTFPNGGKLTPYIEKLNVGDKLHFEGPHGTFRYQKGGYAILEGVKKQYKRFFFIAGGTGIIPCYQALRQISNMPDENIELVLLYANKGQKDIVLLSEVEVIAKRVKIHHILSKTSQSWKGLKGHINEQILNHVCPLSDPNTLFIYDGPKGMNNVLKEIFKKSYPLSKLVRF